MFKRHAILWAVGPATSLYGACYLLAWFAVWRVPVADRDGLEWTYVFLLTLPWSLLAGVGGMVIVHIGALVNATLFSAFVGSRVRRRCSRTDNALP